MSARIVGQIEPGKDGDRATFKIIRNLGPDRERSGCEHGRFVLDERWATVTCGQCNERVDPFAALMRFAEWWQELQRHRRSMEEAEKRLLGESLRRLRRLRDITDTEKQEVDAMLDHWWQATTDAARSLERRVSAAISERKWEKRRRRRLP